MLPFQRLPDSARLTQGLVGYWPLETAAAENTVSLARATSSGNPTWTRSGRVGGGVILDGVDDYLNVAHTGALSLGGTVITVSAWWRFETQGTYQCLVTKPAVDGVHTSPYFLFMLGASNADKPRFYITLAGPTTLDAVGATTLVSGQWYHLTGTYDGANLRIYLNGVIDGTIAFGGTLLTATSPVRISGHATGGELAKGVVDEVRIYNRVLSDAEVREVYQYPGAVYRRRWVVTGVTTSDTFRPSGTLSAGSWIALPSGTLHGVTSDASDSTYAESSAGSGTDTLDLSFPAMATPPAGTVTFYVRHQAGPDIDAITGSGDLDAPSGTGSGSGTVT